MKVWRIEPQRNKENKFKLQNLKKSNPRSVLTWSQILQKCIEHGAKSFKIEFLASFWRLPGPRWLQSARWSEIPANLRAFLKASRQLFEILDAKPQIAKTFEKPQVFVKDFCYSELVGLARSGVLSATLSDVGSKIILLEHLEAMLRHVGAKMATKSAKIATHNIPNIT